MNEKQLFDTLVEYLSEQEEIRESIKDTLDSVKEDGMEKEDIAAIKEAAVLYVKRAYQDKKDKFERVEDKYTTLSGDA